MTAGLARLAQDVFAHDGDPVPCRECGRVTVAPLLICHACYQQTVARLTKQAER